MRSFSDSLSNISFAHARFLKPAQHGLVNLLNQRLRVACHNLFNFNQIFHALLLINFTISTRLYGFSYLFHGIFERCLISNSLFFILFREVPFPELFQLISYENLGSLFALHSKNRATPGRVRHCEVPNCHGKRDHSPEHDPTRLTCSLVES